MDKCFDVGVKFDPMRSLGLCRMERRWFGTPDVKVHNLCKVCLNEK
jgi:hypothetical protein